MLVRYLLSTHMKFTGIVLLIGVVIFFLAEMFEKVDSFSDAGTHASVIMTYFLLRLPEMIATILPAVFFLSTIILLCTMAKSKELLALQSGGISIYKLMKIVLLFAFCASVCQFLLSQFVAIEASVSARALRLQEIRNIDISARPIMNVWFKHDTWVVKLDSLKRDGSGTGVLIYELSDTGQSVVELLQAKRVQISNGEWELFDVIRNKPHNFLIKHESSVVLPFRRLHQSFFAVDSSTDLQELPADQLYIAINELKDAGANVESLETAFQAKFAYAGSIISLSFLAFAIFTISPNVYIGASLGTFCAFITYIFIMLADTFGQDGRISPFMAAWAPHIGIIMLSMARILVARK